MCLIATTKEALIAKKNIKVYKVVLVGEDGRYYSPYMKSPLKDQTECEETILPLDSPTSRFPECTFQGIHARTRLIYAEGICSAYSICYANNRFKIIKGVIPKGTLYWINRNGIDIAAKYIKFDRSEEKNI